MIRLKKCYEINMTIVHSTSKDNKKLNGQKNLLTVYFNILGLRLGGINRDWWGGDRMLEVIKTFFLGIGRASVHTRLH